MTATDLIVLAPWIMFAAGLAVIGVLLLRAPRAPRAPWPRGRVHPDPEDARCREKNAEARSR